MMRSRLFLIALLGLALQAGSQVRASLLFSEGFTGLTDGSQLNGQNGWTAGGNILVRDYTWSSWRGYSIIDNKAIGPSAGQVANQADKDLSTLDTDTGGTIYMSYTLNADPSNPGWTNPMLRNTSSSTTNRDNNNAFNQYSGSTFNMAGDFGSSSDTNTRGTDYLVVLRMVFGAGVNGDTGSLSVFAPTRVQARHTTLSKAPSVRRSMVHRCPSSWFASTMIRESGTFGWARRSPMWGLSSPSPRPCFPPVSSWA